MGSSRGIIPSPGVLPRVKVVRIIVFFYMLYVVTCGNKEKNNSANSMIGGRDAGIGICPRLTIFIPVLYGTAEENDFKGVTGFQGVFF